MGIRSAKYLIIADLNNKLIYSKIIAWKKSCSREILCIKYKLLYIVD